MTRLFVTAFLLCSPGALPPGNPGRVPDPPPELAGQLHRFDEDYRHNTPAKFAELEAKADALARQYPGRDDQARVWYEVAHVAAQSDVRKHAARVRKYAAKCLTMSRDPLQRGRMYSYLASAVDLSGHAFPEGRREAAAVLLTGYVEFLALGLPGEAPELPRVDRIGDVTGPGGEEAAQARARHDAQVAARAEAEFTGALVDRRDTLVLQLRDLYKPDAKRHGHNPEGPEELRVLAADRMTAGQVDALMERL